jgi:D-glycero-alpha-D-manno-heptose 1-phosphate guanylyltransferase
MAPVAGRPFVEWVVRFYARHGARRFVVSTGFLADKIAAHFATSPVAGVDVRCCAETTPLGTAGGFLHCVETEQAAPAAWLVVNGDSLVFADPHCLVVALERGAEAALLGLEMADAARYGSLECDVNGRLVAFAEKRSGPGTINAGVYAFSATAVRSTPSRRPLSFELDVFPALAAGRGVAVARTVAPFLDIGTPETLAQAEQFILTHQKEFLP